MLKTAVSAIAVGKFLGESFLLSYIVINLHLVVVFEVAGAHTCSVVRRVCIGRLRPVRVRPMLLMLSYGCFPLPLYLHLHCSRQEQSLLVASLTVCLVRVLPILPTTCGTDSASHTHLVRIQVIKLTIVHSLASNHLSISVPGALSVTSNGLVSIPLLRVNFTTITTAAYHRLNDE